MSLKKEQSCCEPETNELDLRPTRGKKANEELALMTKAIGHPARVEILRFLIKKQACICGEIVNEIELAQSTVSQHLKVLKEADLIRGDIEGTSTCYCVNHRGLNRMKKLVADL